jgi:hypothetical protein
MPKQTISGLTTFQHFFLEYGPFLAAWNTFDIMIEVALMRLLRLTPKEACIVFASVGFGAKHNILGALLVQTEEGKRKYAIAQEAINLAERNGFAHGFISVSEDDERFTLVRREVKGSLQVKPKVFTPLAMQRHSHTFLAKFEEAQKAFEITDYDLIEYQREVESYAKPDQVPRSNRPRSATNFREANRESRRQRRLRKLAESRR